MDDKAGLEITSMMDMMTIILCFLLKSYSTDDISIAASEDLELPSSSALTKPELAVNVVVDKRGITVDGVDVLPLTRVSDPDTGKDRIAVPEEQLKGQMITLLYDRLLEKAEQSKAMAEATGGIKEFGFKGRILLQCDKTLPFEVVRQVMYTAGQAQFGEFRFVVYMTDG
jgi:biopolymer transport protein ExbD